MTKKHLSAFTFELGTPNGSLRSTLHVPSEPMRLSDLARAVMRLDDELVTMDVKKQLPIVGPATCKRGCTSCCHQLVPISVPEAFMIHDLVSAMNESRQEEVLSRFVEVESKLEAMEIDMHAIAEMSETDGQSLPLVYHRSNTPCVFLENDACSIYATRPYACREYLVSSLPELCSKVGEAGVKRIPVSIRMGRALAAVAARVLGGEAHWIPLPFAIAYGEQHEQEGQRRFDGHMLVTMLLEELSGKTKT